jgi:hypothetical protein
MLLKTLEWAVPLFVSVLLIQVVSDMLYMRAMEQQPASVNNPRGEGLRLPVHVIEREATASGIIT